MAIGILGPLNDVINKTAKEMAEGPIFPDAAKILKTMVDASFDAAGKVMGKVRDLTAADPPAPPTPPAPPSP
jgi:hypothetical protein